MKKAKKKQHKKVHINQFKISRNAKGYPIKQVAFHLKIGKNR